MTSPVPVLRNYIIEMAGMQSELQLRRVVRDILSEMNARTADLGRLAYLNSALAVAYSSLGDQEEAVRYHRNACRIEPLNGAHLTNLGVTLSRAGKDAEAAEVFLQSLEKEQSPKYVPYAALAQSLWRLGLREDANGAYQEAISLLDPLDLAGLLDVARKLASSGQDQACVELLARHASLVGQVSPVGRSALDVIDAAPSSWKDDVLFGDGNFARPYLFLKALAPQIAFGRDLAEFRNGVPDQVDEELTVLSATAGWRARAWREEERSDDAS